MMKIKRIRQSLLLGNGILWALAGIMAIVSLLLFASVRMAFAADADDKSANRHIISLHDGEQRQGFVTTESTLRAALDEAGIYLDEHDRTEPEADEPLVAGAYQVNIYRARPVIVRDGSSETKLISSYRTPEQIIDEAGIKVHDEDILTFQPLVDPIAGGVAEVLTITRAVSVKMNFYGENQTVYTFASTVGDLLADKGIELGDKDGVSPAPGTAIYEGIKVKIWRDGVRTMTVDEDIKFKVRQIEDADREVGYRKVKTPGANGKRTATYQVKMLGGEEVSRKLINSVVTKKPVEQVVVVGVKNNLPPGSHQDWMRAAGISSSDFGYVNYIVMREGGWNPCRIQGPGMILDCTFDGVAHIGYGMVQATPGNKMSSAGSDWRTNPITQLKWANGYAMGRYGSWENAYNYWLQNDNW